ncbi:VWA domain-containing protein [Streptomyces sp. WAC07094]|uniref:VWA domain-containing protein n=1 Tax=Streptomyces sp. WAC07094 TaxID=3072183 RepID=UPI002EBB130B|nr:VWA domain-containing protein [Streptomyces sp. WAC07094]
MGILTLLRNAFGRSRKGRSAEGEPSRETQAASEPTVSEAATAPRPKAAKSSRPAVTPEIPAQQSSGPGDEHELVSAAFDNVTVPRQATPMEEPSPEVTPAPKAAAEAEAEAEAESETVAEADAAPEPEVAETTAPETDAEATTEAEATVEPEAEIVAEPEATVEPEAETVAEADAAREPEVAETTAPETDAEATTEPEAEAEVVAEPEATVEPEADAEATTEPETDAEATAEPEATVEPEAETVAEADAAPEPEVAETTAPETDAEATTEPEAEAEVVAEPEAAAESEVSPEPEAVEPEATPEPEAAAEAPEPKAAETPEPEPEPEATAEVTADAETSEPEATEPEPVAAQAGASVSAEPALTLAGLTSRAPGLTSAYEAAAAALEKHGLTGTRAGVYLVLDRSASMRPYYKDGSAQALGEQALALAAHLDPEASVHVVFFSTELDGTGELTLTDHENKIDELHAGLGRMGRTSYHVAVEAVLAHHEKSDPAVPALVIFQTDGAPDAKTPATQSLTEAAKNHPAVFFSFVAFGDPENKAFDYLRKLKSDNTSAFLAGETPLELTDAEVYEGILAAWRP